MCVNWWQTLVHTVFHLPVVFTVSPSQMHSQTITSSATLGQYLSQIQFSNWFFKFRGEIWSWNLFMPKQVSLRNDWLTEKWTYLYFQLINKESRAIKTVPGCLCPRDHTFRFTNIIAIDPYKNPVRKIFFTFHRRWNWGHTASKRYCRLESYDF